MLDPGCDTAFAVESGGGAFTLDTGEQHEVGVRYSPTECGPDFCAVTVWSAAGCPDVECTGSGEMTSCDVSPTSLDFGQVNVGSHADRSFTITNNGCSGMSGTVSLFSSQFDFVSGGGIYTLMPGESRVVTVRYEPTACGPRSVTVETGAGACSDVYCAAEAVGALCEVVPGTLDFGHVKVGFGEYKTFQIRNTGCVEITGRVTESSPHFRITEGVDYSIPPNGSHNVQVEFWPTACGPLSCIIDTGNGACVDVDCVGYAPDPLCEVGPTDLDFGWVEIGTQLERNVYIINRGCTAINGEVLIIPGGDADYSIVSGGGSYSIARGEQRTVVIRFSPSSCGIKTCTLETGSPLCSDVEITGRGDSAGPICDISTTNLNFGTLDIGETQDLSFTITNHGCGNLPVVISENCLEYEVVSGAGVHNLAANQSVEVTVRFWGMSCGGFTCTVSTGSNCPAVECHGEVTSTVCAVSTSGLDFGTVDVGSHADSDFSITNDGCTTISGVVEQISDQYAIISGGGPYTLNPGESRNVFVRFSPTSCGAKSTTISTGSECADVLCIGAGDEVGCSVAPGSLDFGVVTVGSSKDLSFVIYNDGCHTIAGTISESCGDYSIVSGGGSYSIGPYGQRVVTVRFSPSECGVRECAIETGNSLCSDVTCTGDGQQSATCHVSPTTLNFGTVRPGSGSQRTFVITNNDRRNLSINVSETCSHFRILSGAGSHTLPPGASHSVTVRFEPTSIGVKTCVINTGPSSCCDVGCFGVGG